MRVLFFLSFLSISSWAIGQSGYRLDFKVNGLKDTIVYLGHFYGEATYIKDTAQVNSAGEFTFDGKNTLRQGVYFLVLGKNKQFDLVIGHDQQFFMATDRKEYIQNMRVTGDDDNKLFFENMIFNKERYLEAEPFTKIIQDSTLSEDKKADARKAYAKVNEKVIAHQNEVIKKYPATLTARILLSNQPVVVPDAPKKADGSLDSTFQLRWYREHFFDHMDLGDDAFLQMPKSIYRDKINEYLDKLFVQQPDSLTKAIDKIVSKAKKNQETYKYAVFTCLLKYQQPEIMGLDAIYVNVYDKYFATGEMNFWVNDKLKKNLQDHAERLRKSLVGKTAPNLVMQDANFKPRSMYDIKNKYTVLFIFDPDCGHCKTETPVLVSFYNKKKFDVEVYAVSADTSMAKMRDYIKEMNMKWITVNGPRTYVGPYQDLYDAATTPSLYVLDSKKKIIGKKIPAEKLEDFLIHYEKFQREKSLAKSPTTTKS
ncbi:MAG TPA: redoxin domain-containing protein [Chryseolinea sp.]